MAGGTGLPGIPLALIGVGAMLAYSGVQNQGIGSIFTSLASGKAPAPGAAVTYATPANDTSAQNSNDAPPAPGTANAAKNQAIARVLAAPYGWSTGANWEDLVSLWNKESGWSNTADNPSSGAYGIAQALGHGPTNQYPAGPANPPISSATAQIAWGLQYIKSTYGSPEAAWAHETADNWY